MELEQRVIVELASCSQQLCFHVGASLAKPAPPDPAGHGSGLNGGVRVSPWPLTTLLQHLVKAEELLPGLGGPVAAVQEGISRQGRSPSIGSVRGWEAMIPLSCHSCQVELVLTQLLLLLLDLAPAKVKVGLLSLGELLLADGHREVAPVRRV